MKKRVFSIVLLLCLFVGTPAWAFADNSLPYVTDVVGIISESEKVQLERFAEKVSAEYGCGVYIVVVDDYRRYSNSYDCFSAAENIYLQYNLGLGSEKNGVLLLLSMQDRDFGLAAYGSAAHYAFTDYGKELLIEAFIPELGNNNWYGGLSTYLETSASFLESASQGNPVDVPEVELSFGEAFISAFGISAAIALIVCLVFKAQMRSTGIRSDAAEYVDRSSFNLYAQQDIFLHRSVTRQVIPKSPPPGSGGGHSGGTTIHSSGFSGRSGKF